MIGARRLITILVVSIVTLLIWMVAESHTRSTQSFPGRLEFVVAAGEGSASFAVSPSGVPVTLNVSGPASAIRKTRELLRRESLSIEVPAEHGRSEINDLTSLVNNLPSIRTLGIDVTSVDPDFQVLDIEERVPRTATVRPLLPVDSRVEDLSVEPKNATIYVLRPDLARLPETPVVEAIVDPADLMSLEPGKAHTVNATLRLADDVALSSPATIEPPSAQVRFRLLGALRQLTVDRVRVVVLTPPPNIGDFNVTVAEPLLPDVLIEAIPETIEMIEAGERLVFAVVYLTTDEMEKRITSKRAAALMAVRGDSPGRPVQMVGGVDALPVIEFTIEPVAAASPN